MGRAPASSSTSSSSSSGLKKGPWSAEEDFKLKEYINQHGPRNWRTLPQNAGLQRCGKSCRLRWTNYLRPDIKRGRFSFDEEEVIIQLHSVLGNKWSAIAARLPGRTDNEIKNYWNTHIKKRLMRMGLDPVTHFPRLDHSNLFFAHNNQQDMMMMNIVTALLTSLNQLQDNNVGQMLPPPPMLDDTKAAISNSNNQQFSSTLSTEDEIDGFLNFEFAEDFDVSELL